MHYSELILQRQQTCEGEASGSCFVTIIRLRSLSLGKLLWNINHLKKKNGFILDTNEGES